MLQPVTLEELSNLARNANVVPLVMEVMAGDETPVAIFEKVAAGNRGSFLLESAEHGVWSRYSFVGVNSRGFLAKSKGKVFWHSDLSYEALPGGKKLSSHKGLDSLDEILASWVSATIDGLPPLTSGLVGLMGWGMVGEIEERLATKPSDSPDMLFSMLNEAIVVDHQTGTLLLVSNIFIDGENSLEKLHQDAMLRLEQLQRDLAKPRVPFLANSTFETAVAPKSNIEHNEFLGMIARAKEHVRRGDVFQVVLSQRFDYVTSADALSIYRVLRAMNPSPYMYLLNFFTDDTDFYVVGSSPEALVKILNRQAITHPIAGSRPRGRDWDHDLSLERDLTEDVKERAEHLMLVDLARNDLLKVCEPASISVSEFMQVHKFSHIQHLVSTVEGTLTKEVSAVDVFRATFPAGTLSGAPKPRALEIINDLEPDGRGIYGGVIGYFDFAGNADLAIAIRTLTLKNGVASVQAGAGIVLDSVPENEYEETRSKASAPGRAIHEASLLRRIP